MSLDLIGQKAVVTGAARGIGFSISQRLAALGVAVAGWDINPLPDCDTPVFEHFETMDVTDVQSVEAAFSRSVDQLGRVDILVANAGVNGPTKPAWHYSVEDWQRVIDVNLSGVFLCCVAAVRHMRASGYGRIVIISSVAGKEGNPEACAYGAAKAGVIGFAKGLARELQPSDISVNCIAPAMTETDLLREMSASYIQQKRSMIPKGRFCTAGEIADMTAWVASPRCSFTTGQVFDVTGGRATY